MATEKIIIAEGGGPGFWDLIIEGYAQNKEMTFTLLSEGRRVSFRAYISAMRKTTRQNSRCHALTCFIELNSLNLYGIPERLKAILADSTANTKPITLLYFPGPRYGELVEQGV